MSTEIADTEPKSFSWFVMVGDPISGKVISVKSFKCKDAAEDSARKAARVHVGVDIRIGKQEKAVINLGAIHTNHDEYGLPFDLKVGSASAKSRQSVAAKSPAERQRARREKIKKEGVSRVTIEASRKTWNAVLAACQKHGLTQRQFFELAVPLARDFLSSITL